MTQASSRSRSPSVYPTLLFLLALGAGAYLGWQWWRDRGAVSAPEPQATAPQPSPPVEPADPVAATPAQTHAIEHPLEPDEEPVELQAPAPLPGLDEADDLVADVLGGLVGLDNLRQLLEVDSFVRRAVATVDNLPRDQAPVLMWPLNPTAGKFSVTPDQAGVKVIHPDNARRYDRVVGMIDSVDSARAVAVYRRLYPLFQQAYEELGYPGRYFNDRLVQVMDHLIGTPVPAQPPAVTLVEVKGSVPSLRPWVRYEFVDPDLQSLSAGQKMLLRVGPDHQRRLQAKLRELRQLVARRS